MPFPHYNLKISLLHDFRLWCNIWRKYINILTNYTSPGCSLTQWRQTIYDLLIVYIVSCSNDLWKITFSSNALNSLIYFNYHFALLSHCTPRRHSTLASVAIAISRHLSRIDPIFFPSLLRYHSSDPLDPPATTKKTTFPLPLITYRTWGLGHSRLVLGDKFDCRDIFWIWTRCSLDAVSL